MKVKPLRCHSCGAPVAWYDVDDVGVPLVIVTTILRMNIWSKENK